MEQTGTKCQGQPINMKSLIFLLSLFLSITVRGQIVTTSVPLNVSTGTGTSASPLKVTNFNGTFVDPQAGTIVHLVSSAVTNGRISFDTYNGTNVNGSIYQGRRAAGTAASPTAAIADYTLVTIGGDGYGTTGFHNISLGGMAIKSEGTMTDVSAPTYLQFLTTPTSTITALERGRILSTGQWKFNSYGVGTFTGTPAFSLQVDASGNLIEGGLGGSASWGSITGTLSSQTDLQTALNGKQASGTYATGTGTASGTNTGDQTITLTGNVTGSGTGSFATTIGAGVVTNAMLANTAVANLSGTNTGDQTTVSGNAGTATTLQTARLLNGVSFNGSADVNLTQFESLTATFTLTSQTAAQKLFNTPTNGAFTAAASTSYFFECEYSLSSMSATSGSFGFALGGTATLTSVEWQSTGVKAATTATATAPQMTFNATASNTTLVTASTATNGHVYITGIVRVNAGGTIIPQVSLGVAAAAVVGVNSWFRITPIGTNTATNTSGFN